ncbi:MAG TPA: class I SAM-dependent methyltransferase [Solirubrobacterales bacterium]
MGRLGDLKVRVASRSIRALGGFAGGYYVNLDYPPSVENAPRYGHGRRSNPSLEGLIGAQASGYERTLETVGRYADELARIEVTASDPREPSWVNGMISGLDGASFYGLMRDRRPARYLEIGSGNSTKFVARACREGDLDTKIVSIDPHPRAEVDDLCDEVIRKPLEAADLSVFAGLEAGDILFFDGSHRVFMNSDVAVFFLDILPALPAGVLVGIHDIYLPDDYPADIAERYYSEQYMLAAYLLGGAEVEIVLPAWWASTDPGLGKMLDGLWSRPGLGEVDRHGVSFWFATT